MLLITSRTQGDCLPVPMSVRCRVAFHYHFLMVHCNHHPVRSRTLPNPKSFLLQVVVVVVVSINFPPPGLWLWLFPPLMLRSALVEPGAWSLHAGRFFQNGVAWLGGQPPSPSQCDLRVSGLVPKEPGWCALVNNCCSQQQGLRKGCSRQAGTQIGWAGHNVSSPMTMPRLHLAPIASYADKIQLRVFSVSEHSEASFSCFHSFVQ